MWNFIPKIYIATVTGSKRHPRLIGDLKDMGVTNYEFNFQTPAKEKTKEAITLSCSDNHLQIYKKGLEYPFICVFEDDVYANNVDLKTNLKVVEEFVSIDKDGWDFIFLGHFPWEIGKSVYKNIHESISWCTHAYLISNRGMRFMLKHSAKDMMRISRGLCHVGLDMMFPETGGIDTFIITCAHSGFLKTYCIHPMLVLQYSISHWGTKAKAVEKICFLFKGTSLPMAIVIILIVVIFLIVYLIKKRL